MYRYGFVNFFLYYRTFFFEFLEDSKYRSHFYFIRFGVDLSLLVHLEYVESVKEESVGFSITQKIPFQIHQFRFEQVQLK